MATPITPPKSPPVQSETVWRGIVSAIADTLYETGGYLLARVNEVVPAGSDYLCLESTFRFPTSGRVIVEGVSYWYEAKDDTYLLDLKREDPDNGVPTTITMPDGTTRTRNLTVGTDSDYRVGTVVMLYSRDEATLDLLRQSFLLETAQGRDLDTLGRNYGLSRPRGLSDAVYRDLLKVLIYLDATTIYSIEKVLDVLRGPGNYEVYEQLDTDPHRVFVDLGSGLSGSSVGKSYLTAHEAVTTTTPTTLTLSVDPVVVYGIYADTDPYRTGTNYILAPVPVVVGGAPNQLVAGAPTFDPSDTGKPIFVQGTPEHWIIESVLDALTIQVGRPTQVDTGFLSSGQPFRLNVSQDYFRPWMVGHQIQIVAADNAVNLQTANILEVVSPYTVVLDNGTPFVTENAVDWQLIAVFTGPATVDIPFVSLSGSLVTTVTAMPADVVVDYATIPSMQVLTDQTVDGNDQYPFYLFDDTYIVRTVLDLITAAGVEPVVEVTL